MRAAAPTLVSARELGVVEPISHAGIAGAHAEITANRARREPTRRTPRR
jgi:hypothetical protein